MRDYFKSYLQPLWHPLTRLNQSITNGHASFIPIPPQSVSFETTTVQPITPLTWTASIVSQLESLYQCLFPIAYTATSQRSSQNANLFMSALGLKLFDVIRYIQETSIIIEVILFKSIIQLSYSI